MCDLEYDFNYKPPEINIVNILTVFVYTLLYLTFNAKHMLFYKAYGENIYKFLDFSTQSHLLIFQVCCFTEGGGGSVGQKRKRESMT